MRTIFEKFISILAVSSFFFALIFIIINWYNLPSEVPTHYNSLGQADRWGNKSFIFFLPILSLIIWIFIRAIGKYGQLNIPGVSSSNNATTQQILVTKDFIYVISNILLLLINLISIKDTHNLVGGSIELGMYEMIIFFICVFTPIIFYSIYIYRLGKI